MRKLANLIGEDKDNEALKDFLENHKFPNDKPISNDFKKHFTTFLMPNSALKLTRGLKIKH